MANKQTGWTRAYNEKAYDRLAITIPKGRKGWIEDYLKQNGGGSINGLVNELLMGRLGLSIDEWKNLPCEVESSSEEQR